MVPAGDACGAASHALSLDEEWYMSTCGVVAVLETSGTVYQRGAKFSGRYLLCHRSWCVEPMTLMRGCLWACILASITMLHFGLGKGQQAGVRFGSRDSQESSANRFWKKITRQSLLELRMRWGSRLMREPVYGSSACQWSCEGRCAMAGFADTFQFSMFLGSQHCLVVPSSGAVRKVCLKVD